VGVRWAGEPYRLLGSRVVSFTPDPTQRLGDGFLDWPLPLDAVLYEAEQPIVFVSHTRQNQPVLAFLAYEAGEVATYLLAPTSPREVEMLKAGTVAVREALTSNWTWLVRHTHGDPGVDVWSVSAAEIPDLYLPVPGTPLLPEHEIVFSARALGEGIALGRMPSSVVSFVADAARSALKAVLDHVTAANAGGRPTDAQRALYDLPVQRIAFNSFEIGLSEPSADLFRDEALRAAVERLRSGLVWAEDVSDQSEAPGGSLAETEAVLRGTLALTPPSSGVITAVEVSGAWLDGRRYHLSRASRMKVSRSLRDLQSERIVLYTGRIGEIDDDNLSFTLRETTDEVDHKGTFSDDLLEDMRTHYYESNRVQISGVERSGKLRVTAVVRLDPINQAG
jgi:hypothetical protein